MRKEEMRKLCKAYEAANAKLDAEAKEKKYLEVMEANKQLTKRVSEAEERTLAAEVKAEGVGRAIWEAILRAAQEAVQEDERRRTVERVMMKWNDGQTRFTARERQALHQEMQNRDLLRWAIATGRLPKAPSQPKQPRLNDRKPLKALPSPVHKGS